MAIDMTEVRQLFFEESFENIDLMESGLLDLEVGSTDREYINSIFRAAHSIKGGASIFKFDQIIAFAHVAETLLDEMREGQHVISQTIIDALLQAVDVMRLMLSALQENKTLDTQQITDCEENLRSLIKAPLTEPLPDVLEIVQKPSKHIEPSPINAPENTAGWQIIFEPHHNIFETGNDPINLFAELSALGELTVTVNTDQLPTFDDLDIQKCYLRWSLLLCGDIQQASVAEVFEWLEEDSHLLITPLETLENNTEPLQDTIVPEPEPIRKTIPLTESNTISEVTSVRVGIDKIDALINMVGELVITQSMLDQVGNALDPTKTPQLREGLSQLERNTRELQESVMRIRMLPISYSFNRFPRLVHDLSEQLGKKVELNISGEQTELDKTVLEKMNDPLVHLVRNALDHGIEMPEQRKALGKPEYGILRLHAFHQGGSIIIQISDDGAGFNKEKIRAKAVAQRLIMLGDNLTEEQLYEYIFYPGFSTASQVSDLSGRGVGMDVVRRNIHALGGTIEVHSKPNQGSTFTIRLPLTLAILDGQLIRVGQETYILPLLSILESLRINPEFVSVLAGKVAEVYRLRDEYIPILRLYELFNVEPSTTQLDRGLLVVVEGYTQKVGLFVDELLSQQQIVIKSLESNFKQVLGISGATILGDGSVALILDISGLIQLFYGKPVEKSLLTQDFCPINHLN